MLNAKKRVLISKQTIFTFYSYSPLKVFTFKFFMTISSERAIVLQIHYNLQRSLFVCSLLEYAAAR